MALNCQVGSFTAPTVDGTDTTISLPSNFDPKAIILWTARQTGTGAVDTHGELYQGFATYDGSAVQQAYIAARDEDALGTSDTARGHNTTACLKGYSAVTPTVDFEARLVSFSLGATSNVIIDWFNAPAAAILVGYMVLGGSDIAKARVGSFATAIAATQDVTINAGWGQPDLLLFMGNNAAAFGDVNGSTMNTFGAASSDTVRRASLFRTNDAETTMDVGHWQKARAMVMLTGAAQAAEYEMDLSARASYPTDGFEVSYPDQAASGIQVIYLALQGTFQSAIGVFANPTAGSPPVVQDTAIGFAPKAALVWGGSLPTGTAINSTHADLGAFQIGGTDGTNEGSAARTQDDANTTSFSGVVYSTTKGVGFYISPGAAGVPTLKAEADLSFSGNNLRQSWTTIDTSVAREACYVVLGDASAAVQSLVPNRRTRDLVMLGR